MKNRLVFCLFIALLLGGCTSVDVPQNYTSTLPQKEVIPIEKSIEQKIETPKKVGIETPKVEGKAVDEVDLSNDNYYINSDGEEVHSPAFAPSRPSGASALCGDGTYSFSHSRRGTCSHHGGVVEWY